LADESAGEKISSIWSIVFAKNKKARWLRVQISWWLVRLCVDYCADHKTLILLCLSLPKGQWGQLFMFVSNSMDDCPCMCSFSLSKQQVKEETYMLKLNVKSLLLIAFSRMYSM
jgi:hypothetical protein